MNFLSLDVGTTCCKCQLFSEDGEILAYLSEEYPLAEREGALIVCVVLDCQPMYERSAQLLEAAFSRIGEERRGTEPSCGG